MILVGDKKELVLVMQKPRSKWFYVACFGRKAHYRKDGYCKHTDAALRNVKPEFLHRVKVEPFGGTGRHIEVLHPEEKL